MKALGRTIGGMFRRNKKEDMCEPSLAPAEKSRKRKSDSGQGSSGSPAKKRRISSPRGIKPRRSARLRNSPRNRAGGTHSPKAQQRRASNAKPCTSTPKLPSLKARAAPLPTATSTPAGPLGRNNSGVSHGSHSTDSTEEISCSKMSAHELDVPFDMYMGAEISKHWERPERETVRSHAFSITGSQKEKNQDWCSIEVQKHTSAEQHLVFTVCDGHGILGHMASRHCSRSIPERVSKRVAQGASVEDAITNALHRAHDELVEYSRFNTGMMQLLFKRVAQSETSRVLDYGTTAVVGYIAGDELTVGNVGDSRAILLSAERDADGEERLSWRQLTVDHNPTLRKDEVARVKASGGRVTNTGQELRISPSHLTFLESRHKGLTINMSRAVGHDLLQHAGVVASPEFSTTTLDRSRTQLLVAGSDGIFDVLQNSEVTEIVEEQWKLYTSGQQPPPGLSMERAIAMALVDRANEAWRGSRGDNITAMCLHFPPEAPTAAATGTE